MRFGRSVGSMFVIVGQGRPINLDRSRAVEFARQNSAAVASVKWITRNFSEAPIMVGRIDKQDVVKQVRSPLLRLLRKPNSFYSGLTLLKGIASDYIYTGNAFVLKMRSTEPGGFDGRGRVVSLWWVPSTMITPISNPDDDTIFIDHYLYTVNGKDYKIQVEDIIHFRDGFNPDNPMLGMSGFASLIREVCSDTEANRWAYALLANQGVPGVVITPGKDTEIKKEDAEQMKNDFMQRTSGDNRGMPLVTSGPVEVKTLGFNPEQMNLTAVHHFDEERITAVIGVPAVVVGLGAGLASTSFSSYPEAREAAYESCMIPMQSDFADTLNLQLVPEFHNPDNYLTYFDVSQVRVLQPDINALHVRVRGDLLAGIITLNDALIAVGKEPIGPEGDVRYIPNGVTMTNIALPAAGNIQDPNPDEQDTINGDPDGGNPDRDDTDSPTRTTRALVLAKDDTSIAQQLIEQALGKG